MEGSLGLFAALLLLPLQAQIAIQRDCAVQKPRNVYFISRNMKNIVHWSPPAGLGDGVLYTVKYKIYGNSKWWNKVECTNIDRTWCDLTNETYDYEEQYYARVWVTLNGSHCSKWADTDRFNPITDTKIDPPAVKVSSGDRCISINLTAPEKWKRNSNDKSLYQIFTHVKFEVSILNTKTKRKWNLSVENSSLNVTKLDPDTTYCVTVQSYIHGPYTTSQPSKQVCATTLPDNAAELTIKIIFGYVLPAILAVLFTLVIGYIVHRYIHADQKKPPSSLQLKLSDKCHENIFTPEINNFISIIVLSGSQPSCKSQDCVIMPGEVTVGKNPKAGMPQVQHLGYLLRTQEMASTKHDDSTYRRQQQCNAGLSAPEIESRNISGMVDYGLVLRVSDTGLVQGQNKLLLQKEVLPAERAYVSQIDVNAIEEATRQSQNTITFDVLGTSEVNNDLNPILKGFLQGQPEIKLDEEQCSTIVLDWDRYTGRLNMPDLEGKADEERQQCNPCDQNSEDGLLSRLYMKQISQEASEEDEEESCLLQFKGKWGLNIQM